VIPVCHRMLNPTCIGAACALWVREVTRTDHQGTQRFVEERHRDSNRPTGRGVCADNLAREPFEVPALTAPIEYSRILAHSPKPG
jgi:hypothetical protein